MSSGQKDQEPRKSSAEDSYLRMESEFSISPTQLRIQYQLTGKSETPVLVLDALRRVTQDGSMKVDRQLAYASFVEPSTLVFMRIIPPLPKRKDVEFAYMPWAHQIEKSQTLSGEIVVAIPVEESNPYYPTKPESVFRKASAKQLKLLLQYTLLTSNLKVIPVPDSKNLLQVQGLGAELHGIASMIQLTDGLPVKLRSDRFEALRPEVLR